MSASIVPFNRIDIAINALGGLVNSVTRPARLVALYQCA
jgi:hypothetical protein